MRIMLTSFCVMLAYALAFDELIHFANSESSTVQEMRKAGKEQYQLIRDRGSLPKYGDCWRSALEHIEESCRQLTEETQSDVALHITNCFLEMSGHEVYACESDKKPNLRAICLQSMTDRAFNVYTEFFTHAQNMCWFLRGQVWQETIEENTRRVGKQLDRSTRNQETLLANQRESLELQEKMLRYGAEMDTMLAGFVTATRQHQDLIHMLTASVSGLQAWLIGEVSWLDTALFYVLCTFGVVFITSVPRALAARLPMLVLLGANIFFERLLCYSISRGTLLDAGLVHAQYYNYVSYLRYTFIAAMLATLAFYVFMYKDYLVENHQILEDIKASMKDLEVSLRPEVLRCVEEEVCSPLRGQSTPSIQGELRLRQRKNARSSHTRSFLLDVSRESRDSSRSNGRYNLRTRQEAVTLNSVD